MLPAGAAQQQGALEGHLVLPRSGLGPAIPWQHPPVAQTRDGRHLRRVGPGLICWVLQERLCWSLLQQIGPFKIWEVQRLLQAPGLPLAPPWLLTLRFCRSQVTGWGSGRGGGSCLLTSRLELSRGWADPAESCCREVPVSAECCWQWLDAPCPGPGAVSLAGAACFFSWYSEVTSCVFSKNLVFLSWDLVSLEPPQQRSSGEEAHCLQGADLSWRIESWRKGQSAGQM